MVQIVLDVASEKDADLIKELLKRFKGVEVNSFSTSLKPSQVQQRIRKGLKDADAGHVKPWAEVKKRLANKIKNSKR